MKGKGRIEQRNIDSLLPEFTALRALRPCGAAGRSLEVSALLIL